jgi:hypothetical protein
MSGRRLLDGAKSGDALQEGPMGILPLRRSPVRFLQERSVRRVERLNNPIDRWPHGASASK